MTELEKVKTVFAELVSSAKRLKKAMQEMEALVEVIDNNETFNDDPDIKRMLIELDKLDVF